MEQGLGTANADREALKHELDAALARAGDTEARFRHEAEELVALHQRDIAQKDQEIATLVCATVEGFGVLVLSGCSAVWWHAGAGNAVSEGAEWNAGRERTA